MDKSNIVILLVKKPEQLEEVVVTSKTIPSIDTNLLDFMFSKSLGFKKTLH